MMDLARISALTEGQLFGVNNTTVPSIVGLSNDTRKNCEQRLYVAIEGPNFDGHDYIDAAHTLGAVAALVEKKVETTMPTVQVNNSIQAMGEIAAAWRKDFDIPVLAITGSAGKTTLKELSGNILSQSRQGIITQGNLNNEIGVPLTLTRLSKKDQFAVVEMGMNHAGEIDYLSKMTAPNIAIINNAGPAHLDQLGSVEKVAHAKGEIVAGLSNDGILVFNADDHYSTLWKELAAQRRTVSFGLTASADIFASYQSTSNGSIVFVDGCYGKMQIHLPLQGEHNVRNALAVIAATYEMGCSVDDIRKGLETYKSLENRGGTVELNGLRIINDTYNANPVSVQAAMNVLSIQSQQERQQGKVVHLYLVLGDMAELGDQQCQLHNQIGRAANTIVQHFYCYGNHAEDYLRGFNDVQHKSNTHEDYHEGYGFETIEQLTKQLSQKLGSRNKDEITIVLVKGSRSTGMERVVDALVEQEEQLQKQEKPQKQEKQPQERR